MSALREAMSHAVLGWVKPELDETLRLARSEIEAFVESPSDVGRMRFCAGYLHQVQGTLRMVELYAPAMVAEELELLAQALQEAAVADHDEACSTLMRGAVLLPDYLERLQDGHRDIPIVLLPLLNEIRAARGASGLNESMLFPPGSEEGLAPSEAEIDHARGSLSGRNRELLDTVGNAVKEELLRVKDALDLHLRTQGNATELGTQVAELGNVADTLGMMGLGMARSVVLQQRDTLREVAEGARPADEDTLLDVAGALLYVDASLDDQVARLGHSEGASANDASAAESQRTVEVLAQEAIINFAAAREKFVAFIETNWDHTELADVPRLLDEVAGALRMLELGQASDYLIGVRRYVHNELIGKKRVPGGQQLDTLADAMASLEYYLEALRERRPNREEILEITRASLENLRYWPLPEETEFAGATIVETAPAVLPVAEPPPLPFSASEFEPATDAPASSIPLGSHSFDPVNFDEGELSSEPAPDDGGQRYDATEFELPTETTADTNAALSENDESVVPTVSPELDGTLPPITFGTGLEAPVAPTAPETAPDAAPPALSAATPAIAGPTAGFDGDSADIDDEIREVFLEEFEEEIANLRQLLPAWRAQLDNLDQLRPIRRVFHTLKGSGRLVGAKVLGEFSWKVENMLNRVLDRTRPPSHAVAALLELACEALPELYAALRGQGTITADLAGLQDLADRLAAGEEVYYSATPAASRTVEEPPAATAAPMPAVTPAAAARIGYDNELEGTPASVDAVLREILEVEVDNHLDTVDAWLMQAQAAPQPASEALLRAMHTMNGALAMADVPEITDVTTRAEQYIKRLLEAAETPTPEGVSALGDAAQAVRRSVAALQAPSPRIPVFAALAGRLTALRDSLPETRPSAQIVADTQGTYMETLPNIAAPLAPEDIELSALDLSAYLDKPASAGIGEASLSDDTAASIPPSSSTQQGVTFFDVDYHFKPWTPEPEPVTTEQQDTTSADEGIAFTSEPFDSEPVTTDGGESQLVESMPAEPSIEQASAEVSAEPVDSYEPATEEAPVETAGHDPSMAEDSLLQEGAASQEEALSEDPSTIEEIVLSSSDDDRVDDEVLAAGSEVSDGATIIEAPVEDQAISFESLEFEVEEITLETSTEEASVGEAEEEILLSSDTPVSDAVSADDVSQQEPTSAPIETVVEAITEAVAAESEDVAPVDAESAVIEIESESEPAYNADAEPATQAGAEAEAETKAEAETEAEIEAQVEAEAETQTETEAQSEVEPVETATVEAASIGEVESDRATEVTEAVEEAPAAHAIDTEVADADADVGTFEPEDETEVEEAVVANAAADLPDDALDTTGLDMDLVEIFIEEGNDLLDHSDDLLAKLRETPEDRTLVTGLQRDLHTLKGGARMAGIHPVGDLGHAIESMLESIVGQRTDLDRDAIRLLERGFDGLHGQLGRVTARRAVAIPDVLIAEFNARARGIALPAAVEAVDAAPAAPLAPLSAPVETELAPVLQEEEFFPTGQQEQVRVRADLLDRLVNHAGEVAIYRARLEQQLGAFRGAMSELDRTNTRLHDQLRRLDLETEAQIVARYQREQDKQDPTFDPLELDRFSTLQQLSRALAESAADLTGLQGVLDDLARQYDSLLHQQSRVSSELQDGLMRARMVPFEGIVPRLRRVLRQAAADTGKQVKLQLSGTHGEMDRNVLERMTAPLEHLLRNSVAHGLESPKARRKANKPEEGTVQVILRREGSEMVLRVTDDGAGLNREAIRRRAEQRGLLQPGATIADIDLDRMILEPGFSTYDSVSQLAGRGVGMDVVHNEVRQLGGTLDIESKPGQGATFTLRLPQTLAVTQAVFVQIGETQFAVPVAAVSGIGRISHKRFEAADGNYVYGGEEYTLYDLGSLVGHAPARAEGQPQVPLLLVSAGDLRVAVAVDQVLGNREIVVKPVGPQIASIPGIYGATITGDGSIVVILDVAPLVRRHQAQPQQPAARVLTQEQRGVPLVMVVDDSLTMRKVTSRVLERHNLEVTAARDGVEALERLEERVPDLMLLDIEMPRMDGYELATAMKADPRFKNVPIVMITSRTGDKHRQRAFDIGVQRYMGKPYQELDLMRNVYDLLGIARVRE
ncbi:MULTISPECIES: Hpt domain-containing protein [unclassified Pseudoxanthomonas]|uniref:Hpt domain-containing protein n=1 Tax=unclassified Pseudoxanthomonas TaxID=2645906 RepID=UPI003077E5CE